MEPFEYEALGMATPRGEYPGQFSQTVEKIVFEYIRDCSKVLHLFSGASKIGDIRVDIDHPNATHNMDVVTFFEQDTKFWDYTILDPPYQIQRKKKKLLGYGRIGSIGGNTAMRLAIKKWARDHTWRIIWLDTCAPMIPCFKRVKLWFLLPGGFRGVRVLSLLENEG